LLIAVAGALEKISSRIGNNHKSNGEKVRIGTDMYLLKELLFQDIFNFLNISISIFIDTK